MLIVTIISIDRHPPAQPFTEPQSRFPCCVLLALSWNTTNGNPSTEKLSLAINYVPHFDLCPTVQSVPGTPQNVFLPRQAPKQKDFALIRKHPSLKNKPWKLEPKWTRLVEIAWRTEWIRVWQIFFRQKVRSLLLCSITCLYWCNIFACHRRNNIGPTIWKC